MTEKRLPKYLNESSSPSKKGREQEEKARKHINSGAVWFDQFDLDAKGKDEVFLIDVKRAPKIITLSNGKTEKLFRKAIQENKTPAYLIYLGDYVLKCIVERTPQQ